MNKKLSWIKTTVFQKKTQSNNENINISQLIEEVNEREIRSRNILIFNLPESMKSTNTDRKEDPCP